MLVLGRSVFAIAMIGFGTLSLIYRDFVHNLQPVDLLVPASTPGYVPVAILSGVFLIAAGTLIILQIRAAPAATALAIFFASGSCSSSYPPRSSTHGYCARPGGSERSRCSR